MTSQLAQGIHRQLNNVVRDGSANGQCTQYGSQHRLAIDIMLTFSDTARIKTKHTINFLKMLLEVLSCFVLSYLSIGSGLHLSITVGNNGQNTSV